VENINIGNVRSSILSNAGMLTATLMSEGEEIVAVNCVVMVNKDEDGNLVRTIYSPLE